MEFIRHILLTVCLRGECLMQDVQWFESKESCEVMKLQYEEMPQDGNWETVTYECKPYNSIET